MRGSTPGSGSRGRRRGRDRRAGRRCRRGVGDGLAGTLADVGIDVNLAPVVDLNVNPTTRRSARSIARSRPIRTWSPATPRSRSGRIGDAGVRTVLKHFPGLGVRVDEHGLRRGRRHRHLDRGRSSSRTGGLIGSGDVDAVMVGHVVNGQLDPDAPASLSNATVTDLLRGELGWDGP